MGMMNALSIAESDLSIEAQLEYHLRVNHYPPVPVSMVEPCIEAIDAYWEGDTNKQIALPEGVFYRDGISAPAWAIIEQHHLDAWLIDDYDEE